MIIKFDTLNRTLNILGCKQTTSDDYGAPKRYRTRLSPCPRNILGHPETLKLIMAHNHPSGVAEPSQADERITRRVKSALDLVDIRLLDHLIIGDGTSTSLASRGML